MRINQKLVCFFMILLLTTALGASYAFAAPVTASDEARVTIDGQQLSFDVPPAVVQGRTLLPLRAIFKALGAEVEWNADTRTIKGTKDDIQVTLLIDNKYAVVNGKVVQLDVAATLVDGRTMVPARFIAESLGAEVEWDGNTRTVAISSPVEVTFPDIELEKAIRDAIEKPKGKIFKNDVKKLDTLDASNHKITSLEGLQNLTGLTVLYLYKNSISDLTPIRHLYKLKMLYLWDNQISSIEPLKALTALTYLDLDYNQISNITPLKQLVNLEDLSIGNNKVISLSGLEGHMSLKSLSVPSDGIGDLSPLRSLTGITVLNLSNNRIENVSPLEKLTNLTTLDLSYNQVIDIGILKKLSRLDSLNLHDNPLISLDPLKGLKNLRSLYLLDPTETDPLDTSLYKRYEDIENRVRDIISTVIQPGMTDLEKELALHDYIITHSKYDYDNYIKSEIPRDSHSHYGILVNGTGVCDGYAKAFKILCNSAGIQCMIITGQSNGDKGWEGHAWNLVKIDGDYYQVDPTWDDPTSKNGEDVLAHAYFNISDNQLSADHKWEKSFYPPCTKDNPLFSLNRSETRISEGDWIYTNSGSKLSKIKSDGTGNTPLCDDTVKNIALFGDWIYYESISDNDHIYKIMTDGNSRTKVSDNSSWYMTPVGSSLYYLDGDDFKIYRQGTDGSGRVKISEDLSDWFRIDGEWIYYKNWSADGWSDGGKFYKMKLDGSNKTRLNNDASDDVKIESEWIYYINKSDLQRIYKVRTDGTGRTRLNTDKSSDLERCGDWIYYKNGDDNSKYYRVRIDGTGRQRVED